MAGDWIKMEHVTPDKPEVYRMAGMLDITPEHVVGCLIRVWIWADQQSIDGNAVGVTEVTLDAVSRRNGFGTAMREVGWLGGDGKSLSFPNFDRHNGNTAKERALTNKRVKRLRNAQGVSEALPEKRREEKKEKRIRARKTALPESFGLSERVIEWAKSKGYGSLQAHLDAFKLKAVAGDYRYADWDAAFMEAIRADWARVNSRPHAADKFAGVM